MVAGGIAGRLGGRCVGGLQQTGAKAVLRLAKDESYETGESTRGMVRRISFRLGWW